MCDPLPSGPQSHPQLGRLVEALSALYRPDQFSVAFLMNEVEPLLVRPQPDLQAAARDLVDGGELAGEDGRVAEVTVEDEAAEIDRRRRGRSGTIKVLSPRSSISRAGSRF